MAADINNIVASLQKAAKNCMLTGIYIRSVSISATHNPDCEVIMRITWSFPSLEIPVDDKKLSGMTTTVMSRPDDLIISLDKGMYVDQIETTVLFAAWSLGAWDIYRMESPPIPPGENPCSPGYGIAHDFGHDQYKLSKTIEQAARSGRVSWRFVPFSLCEPYFKSKWIDKDKTLNPDATRDGSPNSYRAKWQLPNIPGMGNEHIYQLGKQNHGNRSKTSSVRRGKHQQ